MVHSYRLYCTTWFMIIIVYLQNVKSSYHILNYVYIYLHLNPILFINNFHKSLFRTHHGGAFLWSCSFFFVSYILYFSMFKFNIATAMSDEVTKTHHGGACLFPFLVNQWCLSLILFPFFYFYFYFYISYIYIYIFMFKFIL